MGFKRGLWEILCVSLERTLENFWQESARDYDEGAQELTSASGNLLNSCRRTRSKPKQTAKIFSARERNHKSYPKHNLTLGPSTRFARFRVNPNNL